MDYFAALPPYSAELAARLTAKVDAHYRSLPGLRPYLRAKKARQMYYGLPSNASPFDVSTVGAMGEQGELSALQVNHVWRLGQRLLTQAVSDDFGWQPVAANGDTSSQEQAAIASSVLEQVKREFRLRRTLQEVCEMALVDAWAWFAVRWDPAAGALYDKDPKTGAAFYEGKLRVTVHPWWRTIANLSKHDSQHSWVIICDWINKWDLAAKYGAGDTPTARAMRERILSHGADHRMILDWQRTSRGSSLDEDEREEIPVFTLFHRATPAVPFGREVVFLADGRTVLYDGHSTYGEDLPCFRVSTSDMLNTPYGMSPLVNLLSLQSVTNVLTSSVATNNINNALQNIAVPEASNWSMKETDGMRIWESNGDKLPQGINLVSSSPETYKLIEILKAEMEGLVGLNAVALGQPDGQLSGVAMALLDSKAQQAATAFMLAKYEAVEDMGTAILDRYKRFARTPRALEVTVGEGRKYMLKDFTGAKLGEKPRVVVEGRNSLLNTTGGKLELATKLIEMKALEGPQHAKALIQVYRTGSLEPLLQDEENEQSRLNRENDMIARGEVPPVDMTDPHHRDIARHRAVMSSPAFRNDARVRAAYEQHQAEHLDAWRALPPELAQALGIPPLPPPGIVDPATGLPMPSDEGGAPPASPADSGAPLMEQDMPGGAGLPGMPGMPQSPTPPGANGPMMPPPL